MGKDIRHKESEGVKLFGEWRLTLRNAATGAVERFYRIPNTVATVAKTMIANNLADNSPDNVMLINYTALGTGTTAPAAGDTQLQTESYRKTTASYTNSTNTAYITAFYTAAECNGTYYEAGLFSNGTASANSGVLVSRVLLNSPTGIAKSATQTLTIDYQITIS